MRTIKFRAWDKKTKKMYPVDEIMMLWSGNPEPIFQKKFGPDLRITNGIMMQFTGLKDKNGKDIYEGDIVDTRYGKYKVEWHEGCSGFIPFMFPSNAPTEEETEVIGNIYENPELLEKKK